MPNQSENNKIFNLEERTAVFGENIICFLKNIKDDTVTTPIKKQLIRSATSIGANYCEADAGESKKDFRHKIGICKKESKETRHWLRMLATAVPEQKETCRKYWVEAHELTLIFSAIIMSLDSKK